MTYHIPNVIPFTLTGAIPYEYTKNGRPRKLHDRYEQKEVRICPFILGQAARTGTQRSIKKN